MPLTPPPFRTGFGFDVHRLVEGRDLMLCGVKIPHTLGLLGHSDADVAIHALCDALLGALALRDIGFHFPDTDPAYKGADSKDLLRATRRLIAEKGWLVGNVDITICAEKPKINPYIQQMQGVMADILEVESDCVSIKATTTEKLGYTGRQEGISAFATALLFKP